MKYCVVLSNVCVLFHCGILLSLVYRVCQNQHNIDLIYLFIYLFILSYALDFITYPILYYFIILMVGCGTYTLIILMTLDRLEK